ncbi:uncharacterized protein [Periplaneta americana]|uniref:uncharacterized protein isoform X2 n=1 Tax=Periplaneta americana TaxID=6978 RepID=UPI0037E83A80
MKWSSIILCLLLAVRGNEVPEECLTCICEAASECDLRTTCGDSLCGPFGISRGFWLDSGSLGNKSQYPACCSQPSGMASVETNLWNRHQLIQLDTHHTDWESCSLDLECAVKTVKRTFERTVMVTGVWTATTSPEYTTWELKAAPRRHLQTSSYSSAPWTHAWTRLVRATSWWIG